MWILAGLIVIAAAIRFAAIGHQSFWTDEALTAHEMRLSFGKMLGSLPHVETTPPLYFAVTWVWAKLFGTGEVALRSVSALAGIAIVPVAYLATAAASHSAHQSAHHVAIALRPIAPAQAGTARVISRGPARDEIALTFDDGFCAACVARIIHTLAVTGAHATIFPNGRYASSWAPQAATIRRLVATERVPQGRGHRRRTSRKFLQLKR